MNDQNLTITIEHGGSGVSRTGDFPASVPVSVLLPDVCAALGVEYDPELAWHITDKATKKELDLDKSLVENKVKQNQILCLAADSPVGSRAVGSPIEADYRELEESVKRSSRVEMRPIIPPREFEITYHRRHVQRLEGSAPVYGERCVLHFLAPEDYPFSPVQVKARTPLLSPNVALDGAFCIGPWKGTPLVDLVEKLGHAISLNPSYLELDRDHYSREVSEWIRSRLHMLPVDDRPVFAPAADGPIRWKGTPNQKPPAIAWR